MVISRIDLTDAEYQLVQRLTLPDYIDVSPGRKNVPFERGAEKGVKDWPPALVLDYIDVGDQLIDWVDSRRRHLLSGRLEIDSDMMLEDAMWRRLYPELYKMSGRERADQEARKKREAEESACKHQMLEAEDIVTAYKCQDCDEIIGEDEVGTLRECSKDTCGQQFVQGQSEERNCPYCNNPFTRRIADHAHPNCDGECDDVQARYCGDCNTYIEVNGDGVPVQEETNA